MSLMQISMERRLELKHAECRKCVFFEGCSGDEGICRRDPPRMFKPAPDSEERSGVWPYVGIKDWCGDFQTKGRN